MATKIINGKTIEFDSEVQSEIYKLLLPDGGNADANLLDWSIVISGVLLKIVEKNAAVQIEESAAKTMNIFLNGKAFVIDAGTNYVSSTGSLKAAGRSIVTAIGGLFGGLIAEAGATFIVGPVGGVAVGFGAGNVASTAIGNGWDYLFGPDVAVVTQMGENFHTFVTSGSLSNLLRHHFTNSSSELSLTQTATTYGEYRVISDNGNTELLYVKSKNNYNFVKNGTEDNMITVLKNLKAGDHPIFTIRGEKYEIAANYFVEDFSLSSLRSDNKALYAVLALRPYVLKSDNYNGLPSNIYSDTYLTKREEFLKRVTDDNTDTYNSYSAYSYFENDLNLQSIGGGSITVNFGDTHFRLSGKVATYLFGSITGDKNDTIKGSYDNTAKDYVEGLDGSDTIYTYGGDDTIYTNANIAEQYDQETSATVNRVYAGDGDDTIIGANGTDIIYADSDSSNPDEYREKDFVEGRGGSDKIYGGDGRDTLYADSASSHADTSGDYIVGGLGADVIHGSDGNDTLYGDNETDDASLIFSDKDVIHGYGGSDTIIGGADSDTLIGGLESGADDGANDNLEGGKGFDTYLVNNGDTIMDSDGEGLVKFDNIDLTGSKEKVEDGKYKDDDYYYYCNDPKAKGPLTVTTLDGSKSITISDWSNEDLGIELLDNKDIEVRIRESANSSEGNSGKRSLSFTVTLSRALEDGESLDVSVSNTDEGSYTFQSGEQRKSFTHSWSGDTRDEGAIDHIATLTPSANYSGPSDDVKVTVKNSGTATVYDDEDKRYDPLALDTNKDGFISTSDLEVSGTYFDLTGDGLRERVGWIKSEDALVTYDKNENGQIDGISEVFGNMNESGFEELKRLIDSNHDNTIDRRDELFSRLQVWNDFNQDAKVQEGELKSLKETGVTSIDLNYVSTNIEINGNLLTEASKYTDAQGNKELAVDIQLATDAKDTKLELQDLPQDFTIDPATQLLPQFKGTGLVYDSLITYNLDPEFKALAQEMSSNIPRVATEFDSFIEQYSGYTAYVNELQEKYSIDNFEMQEVDKQAWIVERFEAENQFTTKINNYYNTNLNNQRVPTNSITKDGTIALKYQALTGTLQNTFAIQSVYQDVFSDTHYDLEAQSFINANYCQALFTCQEILWHVAVNNKEFNLEMKVVA